MWLLSYLLLFISSFFRGTVWSCISTILKTFINLSHLFALTTTLVSNLNYYYVLNCCLAYFTCSFFCIQWHTFVTQVIFNRHTHLRNEIPNKKKKKYKKSDYFSTELVLGGPSTLPPSDVKWQNVNLLVFFVFLCVPSSTFS